jgi:heat shock protein HslJ
MTPATSDDSEALASLDGTSWCLAEGQGISISDDVTMTIVFEAGRVSGSGGCNRFTAAYEEDGGSISFGPVAMTRMACVDEVMAAERAYLGSLEAVSSWSATDDALTFSNQAGDELLRYEVTPDVST